MNTNDIHKIVEDTKSFVKNHLALAEAGHDWWHIQRVYTSAVAMAEKMNVNQLVVELAALLHDIADSKFNGGNMDEGPQLVDDFLRKNCLPEAIIQHVVFIVRNMSFKSSFAFEGEKSIEFQIVQDADRLDAIGAIGIARAFSYGGYKGHIFYDPDIQVESYNDGAEYQKSTAPTINHFYEKLLLLKDLMNTTEGKNLAEGRHQYMLQFLNQFYDEWNGNK